MFSRGGDLPKVAQILPLLVHNFIDMKRRALSMRYYFLTIAACTLLSACGSASMVVNPQSQEPGAEVPTFDYETYITQHNGFSRIRRNNAEPTDNAVLGQFEDSNPASPAGFRSLVDNRGTAVSNRVDNEIIVEYQENGGVQRILRLTTDVEPYRVAGASGKIVLSGRDFSLVNANNVRANVSDYQFVNQSDNGALYLALDFDNETAAIRIINRDLYLHTPTSTPEDLNRVDLLGENLAFNVRTGAFGGPIEGEVYRLVVRLGAYSVPVSGNLLGKVGGAAVNDLVAGGVFEATGTGEFQGGPVEIRVDGIFSASN